MSFLTPLALALAILAVPIILLYMLRLRRREVPVSSTLLWERLMHDREANAPWQRLRRNLLLLLQLLILAALVMALARPFREVPSVSAGNVTVLLDASASMNATDIAGGVSRFARARALAGDIIQQLGEGSTMTLIEVGPVPRVLIAGADDKAALQRALSAAEASHASADWEAALALSAVGAQASGEFSVVIISDGGLPPDLPPLAGALNYIPVGESDSNLAITALSARPVPGAGPELFAQITNFSAQALTTVFSLELDGELHDAATYAVPANQSLNLTFGELPNHTQARASLTRPAASTQPDYLALDDVAWAIYQPPEAGRVLLVSEGNVFIEQLLLAMPGVRPYRLGADQPLPTEPFDLYIFDNVVPEALPPGDLLFIGPTQSTAFFEVAGVSAQTRLLRVAEDDPRMAFVSLQYLNVADFAVLGGVDWATPLAEAEGGPILLAGETRGRQIAIIAFDLRRSDLPLQVAWPVLLANLLQWFSPARAVDAPDVLRPSDSLLIRPPLTADAVRVTRPDGSQRLFPVEEDAINFSETERLGVYTVEVIEDDAITQTEWFAVNLFSAQESAIAPREEISIGATTLGAAQREAVGQQEFWPLVALVALAVLALEWYVYHRGMRLPRQVASPLRRARR